MTSIYTRTGILIKRITGIKDISLFRKKIKKKIGKLLYKKKYNSNDIIDIMCSQGMTKGSVVCIHCSMKEFYNYIGTAEELIEGILKVISDEGTLLMPAYPDQKLRFIDNYIYDFAKEPTKAGFLAETFRKWPGVKRSINAQHSVCAIGKMAEYLINEHHLSNNCFDEKSPWYKLCQLNALVFSLGMPHSFIGTFEHCVEGTLWKENSYWKLFFRRKKTYYYKQNDLIRNYSCYESDIEIRVHERNATKYFDTSDWNIKKISNLEIKVCYSKNCFNKLIDLAQKGIIIYYVPSPSKYFQNKYI